MTTENNGSFDPDPYRNVTCTFIGQQRVAVTIATLLGGRWAFEVRPVEGTDDQWTITVGPGVGGVLKRLHIQTQEG